MMSSFLKKKLQFVVIYNILHRHFFDKNRQSKKFNIEILSKTWLNDCDYALTR